MSHCDPSHVLDLICFKNREFALNEFDLHHTEAMAQLAIFASWGTFWRLDRSWV